MSFQPCDCCGRDDELFTNNEGVVCIYGNKWTEIEVSLQPEEN